MQQSDAAELQQARAIAALASPSRIKRARELRGWTQTELAKRSEGALSSAAVGQFEAGKSRPSAASLLTIARLTDHPLAYFAQHRGDMEATAFFRSLRSAPKREQRRALAWTNLVHDLANAIEDHIRLPHLDVPRIRSEALDGSAIEEIAGQVRTRWELGDGPVEHVVRTLERRGVLVAALPLHRHDLDAFSSWFSERPIVILGQDKRKAGRTRFDAAHELGHLVMHADSDAGTKIAETEAHRFAAAFLMPADSIASHLPPTADWSALLRLKIEWGVSLQALLMRAKTLGVMSEHRYVNAMKQISARGWRKDEPGDRQLGPPEAPRLLELAVEGLASSGTTVEGLAAEAGLPLREVLTILNLTNDQRPSLEI